MAAIGFGIGLGVRQRAAGAVPPPALPASAITSLTVVGPDPIDPDAGGIGVDGNGWVARAVMPWAEGALFDPAKVVLTVADPGFDGAGKAVTRTRTIRGGAILRRQYPNQAASLAANVGDALEVHFSLRDEIYAGSAIAAAVAEAGHYGAAAGGAIGGVVNASTAAYPKPLFAWLNIQHERATGAGFAVEAVVYQRHAMLGRQVACVEYGARDAQAVPNMAAVQRASAPSLSDFQAKGQRVEAYKAVIPLAGLSQGDLCQVSAVVKPWIGEAWDLAAEGVAWPTAQPQTVLRFLCDRDGGYGGGQAAVRAGVSGGAVQAGYALAVTTPYPTINAALAALAAWNDANKGHADHSGGTIWLMDDGAGGAGTHGIAANMAGVAAGQCWTDIRPDPAATGAVTVQLAATRTVPSLLRWCVDLSVPGSFALDGGTANGNVMAAYEGQTITHAGGTIPINYRCGLSYLRNVTLSGITAANQSPFKGFSTTRSMQPLVLGCVMTDAAVDCSAIAYALIGCAFQRVVAAEANLATVPNADPNDGAVIANNLFGSIRQPLVFGLSQPWSRGLALVQNVVERAGVAAQPALQIGADGTVQPIANVLDMHNSIVGERTNRSYGDVAESAGVVKRVTARFNIWQNVNCKADTFLTQATNTGRVGGWRYRYMVGNRGNISLTGSASGVAPDSGGGSWLGETWPDDGFNVGRDGVSFADDQGNWPPTGAVGGGGGNYALSGAANAAYDRVPAGLQALAFDMGGLVRRGDGTGAAGAYERIV